MNKPVQSQFVVMVFVGMVALFLALFPIRIEFVTNSIEAQETPNAGQPVKVAQASTIVEFTLRTVIGGTPAMAYVGVGGDIDGIVNPELVVNLGDTVRLKVINGDPVLHDLRIDEFNVYTGEMLEDEQEVVLEFVADKPGIFSYYCSIPGHRQIGMEGVLRVVGEVVAGDASAMDASMSDDGYNAGHSHGAGTTIKPADPARENAVSIIRNPADVPPPVGDRAPMHHVVELTAVEVAGVLGDGTTYQYMTFDGTVPGPMLRMRVNDTMEIRLHNHESSTLPHSIDLHSVTGPGGGAAYTQTLAGQTTTFTFRALQPGLYVYHCATTSIPHHISSCVNTALTTRAPVTAQRQASRTTSQVACTG